MHQPEDEDAAIDAGFCTDTITSEELTYTLVGVDPDTQQMRICLVYENEDGTRYHVAMDGRVSGAIMRAIGLYCETVMHQREQFRSEVPNSWPPDGIDLRDDDLS